MAAALARADVWHDLVVLPGKGHGFDSDMDDASVSDAFERVIDFLRLHLR
jgi:dipeptidyl aminopeptidase/acylaminoacyl peptidase